jgi:CDP-paratose 2-epimerase
METVAKAQCILVTGSAGLIGSEASLYLGQHGFQIHGIDNNQRRVFFGPEGDTTLNRTRLGGLVRSYTHHEIDVRDRERLCDLVKAVRPAGIVHCAGQPSHELAAGMPFEDFDINAVGTLNLLEAARRFCPEAPFVHMSSNKVYGDGPNSIQMVELEKRWDYADSRHAHGIAESFPIDQSKHSLFGASKVAADIMVQEYGRYFGMPTVCLRAGCLTGPNHAGVELHGFLSYLIKCNLEGREYRVFGYGGKQVRDNLHSADVAAFILEFIRNPRSGEVYNLGGGKENSCSILEMFGLVETLTGRRQVHTYVGLNRSGDHICYYSDLRKIRSHYPGWKITRPLTRIVQEIAEAWADRDDALHEFPRS